MAATRIWIKNPLATFTANDLDASGGLVIDNGVISELLGAGQQPSRPCDQVFDAREHVVLPGLINTHHHFYQTLTRAWAPVVNQPLFPWRARWPWPSCCCPVAARRRIITIWSRMAWKTLSTCRSRWFASWACAPC